MLIFGPKKLVNDELYSLHSFLNVVRVIKSKRMRGVGHVERVEWGEKCLQGFGWEVRMEETTGKTGVVWKVTLKWTFWR
jgi:hypothetical protein